MTRALLEQALKALETCTPGDYSTGHVIHPSYGEHSVDEAIEAIRTHIAKPQRGPVATVRQIFSETDSQPAGLSVVPHCYLPLGTLLYLHPAHTEAEVQELLSWCHHSESVALVRRILGVPA